MRKEISIATRYTKDINFSTEKARQDFITHNKVRLSDAILETSQIEYDKVPLTSQDKLKIERQATIQIERKKRNMLRLRENKHSVYSLRLSALERDRNTSINEAQDIYNTAVNKLEEALKNNTISQDEYNSRMDKLDERLDSKTKRAEDKFNKEIAKLEDTKVELTEEEVKKLNEEKLDLIADLAIKERKGKVRDAINKFLDNPNKKPDNTLERLIKEAYIDYMYFSIEDTNGTTYRNNKIFDMSYAVLTHETTASKMLYPGGFEPEKRLGYQVAALQNPNNTYTWEELSKMSLDDLKKACYTEKNLCFIDTHLQFYKQNNAASTALGMAAVQKVAHAVLESNGFNLDINDVCELGEDDYFIIAGKTFKGKMVLDEKQNDKGEYIGRALGEFVAMFADAVKDPVANLMNINSTTMPIITSLIRLGMPFEDAALFLSQPIVRQVLDAYNTRNLSKFTSLEIIINELIDGIRDAQNLSEDTAINKLNEISREELILNLKSGLNVITNYKVLNTFLKLQKIASTIKGPTLATRLNSISSAVGPQIIDNLMMKYKISNSNFDNFYDKNGDRADFYSILSMHPILGEFYKAFGIADLVFKDIPINREVFTNIINIYDSDFVNILMNDRKLLGEFANFFQSYLLVASGAIPTESNHKGEGLKYYIEEFPKHFLSMQSKFIDNAFVKAIRQDLKDGHIILQINTTGMDPLDKERLSDGWYDLYKSSPEGRDLALGLFYYNFWRTGISFNPKSFMGLFPTTLKGVIPGYLSTFNTNSDEFAENIPGNVSTLVDQFVANNWNNYKLVPEIKYNKIKGSFTMNEDNNQITIRGKGFKEVKMSPYIKIKTKEGMLLFKKVKNNTTEQVAVFTRIQPLGNNGEYFEASISRSYQPLVKINDDSSAVSNDSIEESIIIEEDEAPISTSPNTSERVVKEQKIIDSLTQAFKLTNTTEEQVDAKKKEFLRMTPNERINKKGAIMDFIKKQMESHNISFDEEQFSEDYDSIC